MNDVKRCDHKKDVASPQFLSRCLSLSVLV